MADPVSSLKPLQRALLHADQPLTVLWFLRVGCLVTIVMVSDKLQVARRAPALHRFAGRTARSFHFAAIATAAVALAWSTITDHGALWRELGACAPARSTRVNGLITGAAFLVHFASCHWSTTVLTILTFGLLARASGLAFLLALSALINGSRVVARRDAYTPGLLASYYMLCLQVADAVRSECGPAHANVATGFSGVCYLEALRWGSLSMYRMWK